MAATQLSLNTVQVASVEQLDLDDPRPNRGKLMSTLDSLSTRYGRGSIQPASAGVGGADRTWTMRQELKTPNYTTCWKDLPQARA